MRTCVIFFSKKVPMSFAEYSELLKQLNNLSTTKNITDENEKITNGINIVQLPVEVLMEIFNYVPERCDISLVCQKFYETVCKLELNSKWLSVKDDNVSNIVHNV